MHLSPKQRSSKAMSLSASSRLNHGDDYDCPTTKCDHWSFSSMHVVVNQQRQSCHRDKLQRNPKLDRLAAVMARKAVQQQQQDITEGGIAAIQLERDHLRKLLGNASYVAQLTNQGRPDDNADCMRTFLHDVIKNDAKVRRTIVAHQYREFGLGTAKSAAGDMVLVQLFKS